MEIELDVFSGRPNPSFELGEDEARNLARRLNGLPSADSDARVLPPGLGYRGVQVRRAVTVGSERTQPTPPIRVFGGVVRYGEATFADPGRNLERWLLKILRERVESGLDPILEDTLKRL